MSAVVGAAPAARINRAKAPAQRRQFKLPTPSDAISFVAAEAFRTSYAGSRAAILKDVMSASVFACEDALALEEAHEAAFLSVVDLLAWTNCAPGFEEEKVFPMALEAADEAEQFYLDCMVDAEVTG